MHIIKHTNKPINIGFLLFNNDLSKDLSNDFLTADTGGGETGVLFGGCIAGAGGVACTAGAVA